MMVLSRGVSETLANENRRHLKFIFVDTTKKIFFVTILLSGVSWLFLNLYDIAEFR